MHLKISTSHFLLTSCTTKQSSAGLFSHNGNDTMRTDINLSRVYHPLYANDDKFGGEN